MKIHCKYDRLIPVSEWKESPYQTNDHPEDEVADLAKAIQFQGIRKPAVVSTLSGCGVTGHLLVEAIKLNGWDQIPIDLQGFDSEEMERIHVTADNAIGQRSKVDRSLVSNQLQYMSPDTDLSLFGLENFVVDAAELPPPKPKKPKPCPHCGQNVNESPV